MIIVGGQFVISGQNMSDEEVSETVEQLPLAQRSCLQRRLVVEQDNEVHGRKTVESVDYSCSAWIASFCNLRSVLGELLTLLDCAMMPLTLCDNDDSMRAAVALDPPPVHTIDAFMQLPAHAEDLRSDAVSAGSVSFPDIPSRIGDLLDDIPLRLLSHLKQHQLTGIKFALERKGRALLADEMGTGKTLQSLAIVAALGAFPLLIVCPAVTRTCWAEQIEQWLHTLVPIDAIHVIFDFNGKFNCSPAEAEGGSKIPQIVITSFRMAVELASDLLAVSWKCVIVDESHILHTSSTSDDAIHTTLACELGRRAPHCLMLSGTPSLNNPFDLFNQVDTLRPGLLGPNRFVFASNYCCITLAPYVKIDGCSRPHELNALLRHAVMIRRAKDDVLGDDLPPKVRSIVRLPEEDGDVEEVKGERRTDATDPEDSSGGGKMSVAGDLRPEGRISPPAAGALPATFQSRYARSWTLKKKAIADHVRLRLKQQEDDHTEEEHSGRVKSERRKGGKKLVLFAHHLELLDFLEGIVENCGRRCLRLDGSVPGEARAAILAEFRESDDHLVAVVGVTACAVGVSLAAASRCVFCELPPDCTTLLQAEDRLHRPGQEGTTVDVEILVGQFSVFDAKHFATIQQALRSTSVVTDGAPRFLCCGTCDQEQGVSLPCKVRRLEPRRPMTSGLASTNLSAAVSLPHPQAMLLARISQHTGLLHIAARKESIDDADISMTTLHVLSLEDAEILRQGYQNEDDELHDGDNTNKQEEERMAATAALLPAWHLRWFVKAFLDYFEVLSRFERRRWVTSKKWFQHKLNHVQDSQKLRWGGSGEKVLANGKADLATELSRNRYEAPGWLASDVGCCFAIWCKRSAKKQLVGPVDDVLVDVGPAPLRRCSTSNNTFKVCCAACLTPLRLTKQILLVVDNKPSPERSTPILHVFPGARLLLDEGELGRFCSGVCRMNFRIRRSQHAIRSNVGRLDGGVCARCGVDCNDLVRRAALLPQKERSAFITSRHPQFRSHPALLERLVQHPVEGNCWEADHVVPVWNGGGCAGLDNLQTLCVICHRAKTSMEGAMRRSSCSNSQERRTAGHNDGCWPQSAVNSLERATRRLLEQHHLLEEPDAPRRVTKSRFGL